MNGNLPNFLCSFKRSNKNFMSFALSVNFVRSWKSVVSVSSIEFCFNVRFCLLYFTLSYYLHFLGMRRFTSYSVFFNLNPVWESYWNSAFVNFITLITLGWFGQFITSRQLFLAIKLIAFLYISNSKCTGAQLWNSQTGQVKVRTL